MSNTINAAAIAVNAARAAVEDAKSREYHAVCDADHWAKIARASALAVGDARAALLAAFAALDAAESALDAAIGADSIDWSPGAIAARDAIAND